MHRPRRIGTADPTDGKGRYPMSVRIVTFNLENLDDVPGQNQTLAQRIEIMQPQLQRLRADILCFQ